MDGLYRGLSLGLYIVGIVIIALQLVRFLYDRWATVEREYAVSKNRINTRYSFSIYQNRLLQKFKEAMEIAEISISPNVLLGSVIVIFFTAYFSTDLVINILRLNYAVGLARNMSPSNPVLNILFAVLMSGLPFFYVFFKLQYKRQEISLAMIAVVQNFIGNYSNNLTLAELISKASRNMPKVVQSEWLYLELSIRSRSTKEALFDFARRLDNVWVDDFVDILLNKAEYGVDIMDDLHYLVREMQTSKANEQKRQAMISIYRIGTTIMTICAIFTIGLNVTLDGNNYKYYFLEAKGKFIIEVSFVLLFGSMILVALSGRKRI